MDHALFTDSRPPDTAQWLPLGFRDPPTRWMRGRFDEVAPALPEFERSPFSMAGVAHENELLDAIATRANESVDWARRPVAVVSKSYRLIGHREVMAGVAQSLGALGIDPAGLDTHATLDRYGVRVSLEINLPAHWLLDPGDGYPLLLQLRCLNSVDGTSTLRLCFAWSRLVCGNGLIVGFSDERRLRHRESRRPPGIRATIESGLSTATLDRHAMSRWLERRVALERFAPFADGALKDAWGVNDAARFLHIARTGHDAGIADRFQPGAPSAKRMNEGVAVPGSPTCAATQWHAAQALSWIARDRPDASEHLDRLHEIPRLISELSEEREDEGLPLEDPRALTALRPRASSSPPASA